MQDQTLTGYPSIDKPWLKYYSDEALNRKLPQCTVYELLWQSNKEYVGNIALSYLGAEICFGDLFVNIEKTAKAFAALGVGEGDIVVMVTVTTPETVYAMYALNRLGAVPNMIDPRTNAEKIKEYILEVNARHIVILDAVCDKIVQIIEDALVEHMIVASPANSLSAIKKKTYNFFHRIKKPTSKSSRVYMQWDEFIRWGETARIKDAPYAKDRCCLMVHTGGTTGIPKCVLLSDDNINALVIQSIDTEIDMQREHTWLDIMPPFIAYGFGMGLHLPLVIGMKVFLIPVFAPLKFDELLIKYKPVHMVGVPSYWGTILKSKKLKKADLSYMIAPTVGGDSMLPDLEKAANLFLETHGCAYKITKGYGMTETCAGVAGTVDKNNEIGSVGIPFSKTIISIFEPGTETELPYGQAGEVCIMGPNVMLGYYNNEEASKELIKVHRDGNSWIHSGDIGYMNENGSLFIVDRIKKMIVRYDGFKVFPAMIDQVVMKHDAIAESCTVGVKDHAHAQGKLPFVYAILSEHGLAHEEIKGQLFELCKSGLPEYAQPVDIAFLDKMPLTPIGKVDYRELEQRADEK